MEIKSRIERSWLKKWIKKRTDWYYDEGRECSEFKWWIMEKLIIFIPLMALIYFFTKSEYETFSVFFLLSIVIFLYWLFFGFLRQVISIGLSLIVMGKLGLIFFASRIVLSFKNRKNIYRSNYFLYVMSIAFLWYDYKTGASIVLESLSNHSWLKLISGVTLIIILRLFEKNNKVVSGRKVDAKTEEKKKITEEAPRVDIGSF